MSGAAFFIQFPDGDMSPLTRFSEGEFGLSHPRFLVGAFPEPVFYG